MFTGTKEPPQHTSGENFTTPLSLRLAGVGNVHIGLFREKEGNDVNGGCSGNGNQRADV